VVVLVLAVGAGAWAVATAAGEDAGAGDDAATVATGTATVSRKTLVEREEVDGTLGYGEATPVAAQRPGIVTRLAAEGETVERGKPLFRVDEAPVVLLYGELPAYRRLAADSEDGTDIEQLEENLKALGYKPGTVDGKWSDATTSAVKRWEKALGVTEDGVVELGDIAFRPGAVRVSKHAVTVGAGAEPGGAVVEATSATRVVTVDLEATKQTLVKQGDAVKVELPDGKAVDGTITSVGKVASTSGGGDDPTGDGGTATIEVIVTLADPATAGDYDQAPVDVQLTTASRQDVLAVPVSALLALAEGGYGVELGDGSGRLVAVETGLFADGWVEVSGDGIAEGVRVVVPA
nr:peptidoglycan-binding protein [Actinomycetota bacterium]